MSLMRAKSVDAYVEGVRRSCFEVADLRDCLEYDIEDTARFPAFLATPFKKGFRRYTMP